MNIAEIVSSCLLTFGVAAVLLSSLGMLMLPDALNRLHSVGLAATAGVGLIAAAILVAHPADQFGVKAALIALLAWCFGPVLSHVQAALAYRALTSDRAVQAAEAGDPP